MKQRNPIVWAILIALVAIGLIAYLRMSRQEKQPVERASLTNTPVVVKTAPAIPPATNAFPTGTDTNVIYQIRPDQVLASVNGVPIKLGDLVPLSGTNTEAMQSIDAVSYEYFMDRALVRELMLQTAKKQGVTINESQANQLDKMRALREQGEPGLVAKLNIDQAQIELEMRDAEAFMLQNSLMAQRGSSPNVTPEEVEKYYQEHASDFGTPPTDPQERAEWWRNVVDVPGREALAKQKRQEYYQLLKVYLEELKSKADIKSTQPTPP